MNPTLEFLLSSIFASGLAPAHRADLEKSGITEMTRLAQGIRSVPPSDFHRLLGFRVHRGSVPEPEETAKLAVARRAKPGAPPGYVTTKRPSHPIC